MGAGLGERDFAPAWCLRWISNGVHSWSCRQHATADYFVALPAHSLPAVPPLLPAALPCLSLYLQRCHSWSTCSTASNNSPAAEALTMLGSCLQVGCVP